MGVRVTVDLPVWWCIALIWLVAVKAEVLHCTPEQSLLQVQQFKKLGLGKSACGDRVWLNRFQSTQHPHGHHIFIDIGCNKGFHSMEMFDTFGPELNVNRRALYNFLTPITDKSTPTCPTVCNEDCDVVSNTPYLMEGGRKVVVHCVEPSNIHFAALNKARLALFDSPSSNGDTLSSKTVGLSTGVWHLHNKAVSDTPGRVNFTKDCSTELCSIQSNQQNASLTYEVQVTTVDELMQSIGDPSHVSFMKIDTEGFDPAVLKGAQQTLKRKAVLILEFENNNVNIWSHTSLKSVVAELESYNYVCYYEHMPHLFKISGSCWSDEYDVRQWSNVVCGIAKGPIELMLDSFSYLRQIKARALTSSLITT